MATRLNELPNCCLTMIAKHCGKQSRAELAKTCKATKCAAFEADVADLRDNARRRYRHTCEPLLTPLEQMRQGRTHLTAHLRCPAVQEANPAGKRGPIWRFYEGLAAMETHLGRPLDLLAAARCDTFGLPCGSVADAPFAALRSPCRSYFEIGAIVGGMLHGFGLIVHKTGEVFEGSFEPAGEPHGRSSLVGLGAHRSILGTFYEGAFRGGKAHGAGQEYRGKTFDLPDVGCWHSGKRDGRFRMTSKRGYTLEATFRAGKIVGDVAMKGPRQTYVGAVDRRGQPSGMGTMFFATGDVHSGTYQEGREHGPGTRVRATGEVIEGVWDKGVLVAQS